MYTLSKFLRKTRERLPPYIFIWHYSLVFYPAKMLKYFIRVYDWLLRYSVHLKQINKHAITTVPYFSKGHFKNTIFIFNSWEWGDRKLHLNNNINSVCKHLRKYWYNVYFPLKDHMTAYNIFLISKFFWNNKIYSTTNQQSCVIWSKAIIISIALPFKRKRKI